MTGMNRRAFMGSVAASALAAACKPQENGGEAVSADPSSPAAPPEPAADAAAADPFARLDGTAQAELVARGEVTPLELVDAAIARLERFEPKLNVLISERFEAARKEAQTGTLPAGPFRGVPWLLKDIIPYPGLPYTIGSRMNANVVPDTAPPFVKRIEGAGLMVLGKTNTPEYGLMATTEPLLSGPTHNPWSLEHSPGGSSGGSAAAVAAGLVPFAHATDGGGSIRIPASCCGLFGLKPSQGRQVGDGRPPQDVPLSVGHCVSRSVRDSARLLSVTERKGDKAVFPPTGGVEGPSKRRLKIAFSLKAAEGVTIHPEVKAATESAAALCSELGHEVGEAHLPVDPDEFGYHFFVNWAGAAAGIARGYREATGRDADDTVLEPFTLGLAAWFAEQPDGAYEKAVAYLNGTWERLAPFFEAYDVTLTPVLAKPPVRIGEQAPTVDFDTAYERITGYVAFTPVQNAAGMPAMSVPLAWSAGGLPIGTHFSAARGDERTLLELAYELEQARPWADKWPPHGAVNV
ncbi:MAG: amidase [Alphaproteobacteria bacterium]